jgi:hypothetical protein
MVLRNKDKEVDEWRIKFTQIQSTASDFERKLQLLSAELERVNAFL